MLKVLKMLSATRREDKGYPSRTDRVSIFEKQIIPGADSVKWFQGIRPEMQLNNIGIHAMDMVGELPCQTLSQNGAKVVLASICKLSCLASSTSTSCKNLDLPGDCTPSSQHRC